MSEPHLWNSYLDTDSDPSLPSVTNTTPLPSFPQVTQSKSQSQLSLEDIPNNNFDSPHNSDSVCPQIVNKEFQVYSRRTRPEREKESTPPLGIDQESEPSSEPTQIHSGEEIPIHSEDTDFEKPIALRKGVRSCTNHPISKFVS